MAIGGTVDDGPFQDIVALDFPQGDNYLSLLLLFRLDNDPPFGTEYDFEVSLELAGNRTGDFATTDYFTWYDSDGDIIEQYQISGGLVQYVSKTTWPEGFNSCYSIGELSTPSGFTYVFDFADRNFFYDDLSTLDSETHPSSPTQPTGGYHPVATFAVLDSTKLITKFSAPVPSANQCGTNHSVISPASHGRSTLLRFYYTNP